MINESLFPSSSKISINQDKIVIKEKEGPLRIKRKIPEAMDLIISSFQAIKNLEVIYSTKSDHDLAIVEFLKILNQEEYESDTSLKKLCDRLYPFVYFNDTDPFYLFRYLLTTDQFNNSFSFSHTCGHNIPFYCLEICINRNNLDKLEYIQSLIYEQVICKVCQNSDFKIYGKYAFLWFSIKTPKFNKHIKKIQISVKNYTFLSIIAIDKKKPVVYLNLNNKYEVYRYQYGEEMITKSESFEMGDLEHPYITIYKEDEDQSTNYNRTLKNENLNCYLYISNK